MADKKKLEAKNKFRKSEAAFASDINKKTSTDDIMAAAEKHKKPKTEEDLPKGPDSDFEQMKRFMRIKAREDKFKKMPLKPGEEGKAEPIGTHDPSEKPVYKKL